MDGGRGLDIDRCISIIFFYAFTAPTYIVYIANNCTLCYEISMCLFYRTQWLSGCKLSEYSISI